MASFGRPLRDQFRDRLFGPLGLGGTLLPASDDVTVPQPFSHGYMYGGSRYALADDPYPADLAAAARSATLLPVDYTHQNPSYATAAGGAISTADDLADWIRALVIGKVFNPEFHRRWLDSLQPEDPRMPDGPDDGAGPAARDAGSDLHRIVAVVTLTHHPARSSDTLERMSLTSARILLASMAVAGGAFALAGTAAADPSAPIPTPVIGDPAASVPADPAAPVPGQPVAVALPEAAPSPPALPIGEPPVPEVQNQVYGSGQTPGSFGYLRDLWHASRTGDPVSALTMPPDQVAGAPAGAGPAPKLPPGYTSITAPESSTPGRGYASSDAPGAPPLPPGYLPIDGAAQPGWYDQPPVQPGPALAPLPVPLTP